MMRRLDPSDVLTHPRVAALHPDTQAVYLRLLATAGPRGHLEPRDLYTALATLGARAPAAHDAMRVAGLLDDEPHADGFWIVSPLIVDAAVDAFADCITSKQEAA